MDAEAKEWLTQLRTQMQSGKWGPQQKGGVLQIPHRLPHVQKRQARQDINTVLTAAGWVSCFGDEYLMMSRNIHVQPIWHRHNPFGFDFPSPEETNRAIFRERVLARLESSPPPRGIAPSQYLTEATVRAQADNWIDTLFMAIHNRTLNPGTDGWYNASTLRPHHPLKFLKQGSDHYKRLVERAGPKWEVRIRWQHDAAEGMLQFLELRPRRR